MLAAVEKITGRRVTRRIGPRRTGDSPVLVADVTKAKAMLGWKARFGLSDMVSTAWEWMRKNNCRSNRSIVRE